MARLSIHIVGAITALLIAAAPLKAQDSAPKENIPEQAEKAIKEGVEVILRALGGLVQSIPQYEMPEVLENGDIIIRRKKPQDKKKAPEDTDAT